MVKKFVPRIQKPDFNPQYLYKDDQEDRFQNAVRLFYMSCCLHSPFPNNKVDFSKTENKNDKPQNKSQNCGLQR